MVIGLTGATTGPITATIGLTAITGPTVTMVMGGAGATETALAQEHLILSRVQSKPVATLAKSHSATGSARWLKGTRLACTGRVSYLLIYLCSLAAGSDRPRLRESL
jgi:hypothetical protein